jgi:hypothetical protein
MDQMEKSEEVVDKAKQDLEKLPKRTGPAGLLVAFYIIAALVGLLVIAWFLWIR